MLVRLSSNLLADLVGGREVTLAVPPAVTSVRGLFDYLSDSRGKEVQRRLFCRDQLCGDVVVMVDGLNIASLQGLNTPIGEGMEVLVLLMPAAGG